MSFEKLATAIEAYSKEAAELCENLGLEIPSALARVLQDIQEIRNVRDKPITLAVFGTGKAGKTTFINNLIGLNGNDALPVDEDPCTSVPILIREANDTESPGDALLIFSTGAKKYVPWAIAKRYCDQVARNEDEELENEAQDLACIEKLVKDMPWRGLQVRDLPGTGTAWHDRHSELAIQSLKTADGVLYVFSGMRHCASPDIQDGIDFLHRIGITATYVLNVWHPTGRPFSQELEERAKEFEGAILDEYRLYVTKENLFRVHGAHPPGEPSSGWAEIHNYIHNVEKTASDWISSRESKAEATVRELMRGVFQIILGRFHEEEAAIQESQDDHDVTLTQFNRLSTDIDRMISLKKDVIADEIEKELNSRIEGFLQEYFTMSAVFKSKDTLKKSLEEEYLRLDGRPNWIDYTVKEHAEKLFMDIRFEVTDIGRRLKTHAEEGKIKTGALNPREDFSKISVGGDFLEKLLEAAIKAAVAAALVFAAECSNPVTLAVAAGMFLAGVGTDPLRKARNREIGKSQRRIHDGIYELRATIAKTLTESKNQLIAEMERVLSKNGIDLNQRKKAILRLVTISRDMELVLYAKVSTKLVRVSDKAKETM